MARAAKTGRRSRGSRRSGGGALRRVLRWTGRIAGSLLALLVLLILIYAVVPVPTTAYMIAESWRQGGVERDWIPLEDMAPEVARSVVAAEDANYCLHWGFDMAAIRQALDEGANRGASTLSQQTVKNVFLWQGRSWPRKALEAVITPLAELVWTKRRMLEIYLNVAEMGRGVFGIEAAARHYFGVSAKDLTPVQAARIAAALPDPKDRDPAKPSSFLRSRARAILAGAETIRADGRAGCFED